MIVKNKQCVNAQPTSNFLKLPVNREGKGSTVNKEKEEKIYVRKSERVIVCV